MQKWILAATILILSACSVIDRSQNGVRREVKDVNYQTKKEDSSPRKRLMVLPFLDASGKQPADFRDRARDAFIQDLNRQGEVIALDTSDLKTNLSLLQSGGQYKLPEIAKLAQNLGVTAVLEAKIVDIRVKNTGDNIGLVRKTQTVYEVRAQVRVYSSRSGREVFNTLKTVTVEEQGNRVAERSDADRLQNQNSDLIEVIVKDAFLDFVPQVLNSLEKVGWEGRIAAIAGDRIYLNVGRVSGLQVGDLLKVIDEGDDVYDPESGTHIGRVPGRLKGTLEVISYFGNDGAISVIHSGSGFRENDRVEIY